MPQDKGSGRVEYRPAQRRLRLILSAVFTLWAAIGLVLLLSAIGPLGFPQLGLIIVWLVPYMLNCAFGRTITDERGVRIWRPIGRRECAWTDVADITTRRKSGGSEVRYDMWLYVHQLDGRSFRLPAPMTSSAFQDKQFEAKRDAIIQQWQRATGKDPALGP
ncbi:hypothetical protein AB0I54_00240 [Streptomyces sp. NPDC050625]|uniref:hypothetical protein n=1 Tax=Streptomyces sp. NPDC050625 TaxID=3154629 RepID=UPI003433230B